MKKEVIIGIIVAIVIVAVVVGYFVLWSGNGSGATSAASALAGCLSPLSAEKLPNSLGGFSGDAIEIIKPYSWSSPDGTKSSMPLTKGYTGTYTTRDGKMLMVASVKFKKDADYNRIKQDLETVKSQSQAGVIAKTTVEGAETYLWEIPSTRSISYYIFAGDNTFTMLMFAGVNASE